MTPRRTALLFAILTALVAAPSAALAAPPNVLLGAAVTPPAGTTATPFTLSVAYLSTAGTPASSVSATVAGRTLALGLVAGGSASGTWATTIRLPAGSWPTTFRATPAKGPQPVVAGPTISVVTVTAGASTTPSATPDLGADADPSNQFEGGGAGSGSTSPPAPPAAPVASAVTQVSGSAAPAAVSTAAGAPSAAAAGSGGTPVTPGPATPGGGAGASAAPAAPAASITTLPEASVGAIPFLRSTPLGDGSEGVWAIMIGGLVAVAAVALIGGAWLVVGRRRQPATADGSTGAAAVADAPEETTDELLSRRSRTRARMKPSDDPVLAAMGLDAPPRRPSRASQVDRGPTLRDATRRRTRP